jgi:RND family efflux transporter MFP subunit
VRNSFVTAIGSGQALRSVAITPEASGRIVEIDVAPGDYVQAGTILARLDSSAEDIALDRAELVLTDARATAERFTRLQSAGAATEIQIRDANLNLRKAELEHRQAKLDLDRLTIVAPISGWVGFVDAELGDQVSTATRLTGIDDRSSLLVEFLVPERHVNALSEGLALRAAPLSRPGVTLDGRVRALDNRVDEASRALRVLAEIANADDTLRPGMAFTITIEFSGDTFPGVDPLAIQWSSNGAFVWVVRDDQAQRVPIRIVQRNADIVLIEGALADGDLVITEGVQSLRPGGAVRVQNAPPPAQQEGAAEQALSSTPPAPI